MAITAMIDHVEPSSYYHNQQIPRTNILNGDDFDSSCINKKFQPWLSIWWTIEYNTGDVSTETFGLSSAELLKNWSKLLGKS